MTTNLSPEYKAADEAYRAAKEPSEKLAWLERMLSTIPKHKGTEKMQADLKRRIAQLRDGLQKSTSKKGFAITVERAGAAQVVLLGAPNAGKSSLVEAATNARVEVGDHPFATRSPVPAMLAWEDIQFQLVDLPPVSREYMESWVSDIVRIADAALWVVDAGSPAPEPALEETVAVLAERKVELIGPGDPENPPGAPLRRLHSLVLAAKMDLQASAAGLLRLRARFEPRFPVLAVSAMADPDFEALGRALFDLCRLVRVFSKTPGKEPDRARPFVLHRGDTLLDFARLVHRDFEQNLKFARVWGAGKFDGQRIQRDQPMVDGDVVELHT